MSDERNFYGSQEAGEQLGLKKPALRQWLMRHTEYRPTRRISGDDLLWTREDIERVRQARATIKQGQRPKKKT